MPEYLTAAAAAKKYPAWWANILKAVGQLVIIAEPTPPVVTPPVVTPPSGVSVFRTPVAGLTPGDEKWIRNLRLYGDTFGSEGKQWTSEFGMDPTNDYSIAVYDAAEATGRWPVVKKASFGGYVQPGVTVPWNGNWTPPAGLDGYCVVIDHQTGHEWGLWSPAWLGRETANNHCLECKMAKLLSGGFGPGTLCAASAFQVTDPQGRPVDTRTYAGNFPGASGGGWPVGRLAVTPEEVLSGRIGHALHMYVANTMHDGGPVKAVAPAGQHERAGWIGTPEQLDRGIPEGTRFSLDMTLAERGMWVTQKVGGTVGPLGKALLTILDALCEYGWFVGDTSPHAASFVFASAANPATRDGWKRCGIPEGAASKSLLAGLPMDRLRVWAPPEQLVDGRWTQGHGWASDARYRA